MLGDVKALATALKMVSKLDRVDRLAQDWIERGMREKKPEDFEESSERTKWYDLHDSWNKATEDLRKSVNKFMQDTGYSPILRYFREGDRGKVYLGLSTSQAKGYRIVELYYPIWFEELNLQTENKSEDAVLRLVPAERLSDEQERTLRESFVEDLREADVERFADYMARYTATIDKRKTYNENVFRVDNLVETIRHERALALPTPTPLMVPEKAPEKPPEIPTLPPTAPPTPVDEVEEMSKELRHYDVFSRRPPLELQQRAKTIIEKLMVEYGLDKCKIFDRPKFKQYIGDKERTLTHLLDTWINGWDIRQSISELTCRIEPVAPPPAPLGLSEEQKKSLEDAFRRVFEEAGVKDVPLATFRDELARLSEDLRDMERARAFDLAYRAVVDLAGSMIPARAPPTVAPPAPQAPRPEGREVPVSMATYLGPRTRQRMETFTCMVEGCGELVVADRDLEDRVRLVPVLKSDSPRTGPVFEPLLRFPPAFYFMCPVHRKARFGYTGVYDALAFLKRETEIGGRMTVVEDTFKQIGLDSQDLEEIRKEKAKYLPKTEFR